MDEIKLKNYRLTIITTIGDNGGPCQAPVSEGLILEKV